MATGGLPQSWELRRGGKAFDPRSAWTGHDPERDRSSAACRPWRSFATLHAVYAWWLIMLWRSTRSIKTGDNVGGYETEDGGRAGNQARRRAVTITYNNATAIVTMNACDNASKAWTDRHSRWVFIYKSTLILVAFPFQDGQFTDGPTMMKYSPDAADGGVISLKNWQDIHLEPTLREELSDSSMCLVKLPQIIRKRPLDSVFAQTMPFVRPEYELNNNLATDAW